MWSTRYNHASIYRPALALHRCQGHTRVPISKSPLCHLQKGNEWQSVGALRFRIFSVISRGLPWEHWGLDK